MGGLQWLTENWVTALNAMGVVGSLLFTAASFRMDAKSRRVGNLIALTKGHRDIWSETLQQSKLRRILDPKADPQREPTTWEEEVFVRLVIVHLYTVFQANKGGLSIKPEGTRRDVWAFFTLPVPSAVWERERVFQDDAFVAFVEECKHWK